MTDAITKALDAATEVVCVGPTAERLRDALPAAREELARLQAGNVWGLLETLKERDRLRSELADAREELEQLKKTAYERLLELDRLHIELARLRSELAAALDGNKMLVEAMYLGETRHKEELAAARAPMVVTTEIAEACCADFAKKVGLTWPPPEFEDDRKESRECVELMISVILPHLRPAPMPSEDAVVNVLFQEIDFPEESGAILRAARAILALFASAPSADAGETK